MTEGDQRELSNQVHNIWNEIAPFWDDYMGEGNDFQRMLIAHVTERLLALKGIDPFPGLTIKKYHRCSSPECG